MNLRNKTIIVLASVLVIGCYKLDQQPYNEISIDKAFVSVNDAKAWHAGLYSKLRNMIYGPNMFLTDIQSDILNASAYRVNIDATRYDNIHRWETFQASDENTLSIWRNAYSLIANTNRAISGFATLLVSTEKEQEAMKYYTGEAYLIRAYTYLQLATMFCKPYTEATANADLGLPLILEYDPAKRYSRSTLEQTYAQIVSDIEKAEELLKGKRAYLESNNRSAEIYTTFNEHSVIALKARVLLYMQKWPEAYETAENFLAEQDMAWDYYLSPDPDDLKAMWHSDVISQGPPPETITQLYASTTELPTINAIYLNPEAYYGPPYGSLTAPPLYIPTKEILDLYEDDDNRKAVYFEKRNLSYNNTAHNDVYLVGKYPGSPNLRSGNSTNYAHAPKVFRYAELHLIAAEAAYHTGGDALTRLNELKTARGLFPVFSSGADLYKDIQEERLREFAFEGMRLFDLKRWGLGVKRGTPQGTAYLSVNPANQFTELDRPANDNKMTWGIPTRDAQLENIIQNPGW